MFLRSPSSPRPLLILLFASVAAAGEPVRPPRCQATPTLACRGLPTVSADGVWYAAPLEQFGVAMVSQYGISDVQFFAPDHIAETITLVTWQGGEVHPRGSGVRRVNARLREGGFVALGRPLFDYLDPGHAFRVRHGDLVLSGEVERFTVRRGDTVLLTLRLKAKPRRKDCGDADSWIDAVYFDDLRKTVVLRHAYKGSDSCPEPDSEWSAHRIPASATEPSATGTVRVTANLDTRGLPAVSADGATYAAPLEENDGMSDREGRAVQLFAPERPSETLPLISYQECTSDGLAHMSPHLRTIVAERVSKVNARLQDGGFVPLGKPLLLREGVSQPHKFRVRQGDLLLSSDERSFTIARGDKLLASLPLPTKPRRDQGCTAAKSWIAAVYLDEAHQTVILHHLYEGNDGCPEPIDDWSAHRIPLP